MTTVLITIYVLSVLVNWYCTYRDRNDENDVRDTMGDTDYYFIRTILSFVPALNTVIAFANFTKEK